MPYHIGTKGSHGCAGFPVVATETGEVMGCHTTEQDAKKQLAALYINVEDVKKAADGFVPPQSVRDNAKRGLELRKEFNRGGTEIGVARARDLSNGKSLPLETINRMVSYFARHEVDKKGKDWGNRSNPSAGYIAWLLWGGDAGKSWANGISNRENKEKSMTANITSTYAQIIKQEKQDDGTLLVYGKATDDSVDIDQQICDAAWLEKAMPEWFKTGGNIREQHSNIAAGVAKELDSTSDGHYISALVVDPVSVKKVETGVLKGFSIGIRGPRVVRDNKAANGRIIDGQIVEVSLVDRPANPNAKLMLAKSQGTEVIKVEELIEQELPEDKVENTTVANTTEAKAAEETAQEKPSKEELLERYAAAKQALDECKAMCKEAGIEIDDEEKQYGETAEEETEEGSEAGAAEEEVEEAEGKKPLDKTTHKCLECGCGDVSNSHGSDDVTTATIVTPNETPKSTTTVIPRIDVDGNDVADDGREEDEDLSNKTITAIIEKAVKSATETVVNEINVYKGTINKLETELATAKTKAVAGGPKRAAIKPSNVDEINDLQLKAIEYRHKAANTSDKVLAKGYKEIAQDFEAKLQELTTNK